MENTPAPAPTSPSKLKKSWKVIAVILGMIIVASLIVLGIYFTFPKTDDDQALPASSQVEEIPGKNKTETTREEPILLGISQFGSSEDDTPHSVAVDASGIYVAGETDGSFYDSNAGDISLGEEESSAVLGATHTFGLPDAHDGYVAKYSLDGKNKLWAHQFGTEYFETARGVAVTSDAVYVAGETEGSLHADLLGNSDVFLQKYSKEGTLEWSEQFGTKQTDEGLWIVADEERICTGGGTLGSITNVQKMGSEDIFIRCYNPAGEELWTLQFGSTEFEEALGATIDDEGIYLVGSTAGQMGDDPRIGVEDSWLGHISLEGELLALRQYGSKKTDFGHGIATDNNSVYTSGRTEGTFTEEKSFGMNDSFISAFSKDGASPLWQDQYGTPDGDASSDVFADDKHGIFMIGIINGKSEKHGEITNEEDAFIRQYSPKGKFLGSTTIASDRYDEPTGITIFNGIAYIIGRTGGTLDTENFGAWDSFIARYDLEP